MLQLIKNKIELAELNLDHNRNELMSFELRLTFLTAALDLCCMICGLFGMNVVIPLDDRRNWFAGVCWIIATVGVAFFGSLMLAERKIYS